MALDTYSRKYFNDTIYGGIGVSDLETELIDTREFQRLRRLRQLGLVSYVFPCAEHTRFTHSLGTLMLMGKMTEHLVGQGWLSRDDQKKLRVAALLHDIGHYPYSHLVEQVYMYKSQEESSVDRIVDVEFEAENSDSLLTMLGKKVKGGGRKANHERLGAKVLTGRSVICNILKANDLDPIEIGSIITGEFRENNMIYCQLMHSSLDCDRLDYLPRDSYSTGVNYGVVDVDYLVRLLTKGNDRILSKEDVIGIDERGQNVVEHYLMARYFHYSKVIGHKTIRAFECVAKAASYIYLKESTTWPFKSYEQIVSNIDTAEFLNFDDSYLMQCMEREANGLGEVFSTYVNVIRNRIRPRVLFEVRSMFDSETNSCSNNQYHDLLRELKRNPSFIAEAMNLHKDYVGWQEAIVNIEDDPFKPGEFDETRYREAVRIVDKDKRAELLVKIEESIISKLAKYKSASLIIFYIEDPNDNPEEAERRFTRGKQAIEDVIKAFD